MTVTKTRIIAAAAAIIATVLILVLVLSFTGGDTENPMNEISEIIIRRDIGLTNSLEGLVEYAEIIVVGQYEGLDSTTNLARNFNNPSEEDPERYVEGKIFKFNISDVLMGDLDEATIFVAIGSSTTEKATEDNAVVAGNGLTLEPATKTTSFTYTYIDPLYTEPEIGATYMLFLTKIPRPGFYMESVVPGTIMFDGEDAASIKSGAVIPDNPLFKQEVVASNSRTIEVDLGNIYIEDFVSGKSFDEVKSEVLAILGK